MRLDKNRDRGVSTWLLCLYTISFVLRIRISSIEVCNRGSVRLLSDPILAVLGP